MQSKPKYGLELSPRDIAERLGEAPAFQGVSRACLESLAELATMCTFRRGEEILTEGELAQSFYLILIGRVKMYRALPTGRNVVLALFNPGELFGAVAALGAQTCDASMTAQEDTSCLEIGRDDLFELFKTRPELVAELLPVLTQRLAECKNCIIELTCYRVETRFAQLLLKFADSVGRSRESGTFVPIPLSRQELADMTGTTIETCIRIMSRWGKEGVVETQRNGFLIKNREVLEQLSSD